MSDLDLVAIEARANAAARHLETDHGTTADNLIREDVPALVAEVRRLSLRPSRTQISVVLWEHMGWASAKAVDAVLALFPTVEGGDANG